MSNPHEPTDATRRVVAVLTAAGIRQEIIGRAIGVSDTTLRKYYPDEIAMGTDIATAQVAGCLFKNATENMNVAAQIFWLKSRSGWNTPQVIQNPDGSALAPVHLMVEYVDANTHTSTGD